ncbi:YidC/Oxa1 family membrane protein insertase, partial [Candidatus Microgenomates bacterium]|nr:YidC/Oxa1 family membrane protein insertase [Candidatus Microgenomates bacterium]
MSEFFLNIILYIYNTVGFQNLGLAITEIAILTRIVFYPFLKQQLHYSKKMAEIQPHLAALKEKHKDNKQAMATAQMELFKEHGVNPAAGCLPAIIQIVVLFGLLGAMNQLLTMKLNTHFWIWDMARPDAYKIEGLPFALPGILVIIAAATQFIQTKMMMPFAGAQGKPQLKVEGGKPEEKKEFMEEFAQAQGSMLWMFPLMFLFLGTQWPSGLALYWSVGSLLSIWQQYRVSGWG